MKSKTIKLYPEIKDDMNYVKHCKSEELSYEPREKPLPIDVDKEYDMLRQSVISSSVTGEIVSVSSKMSYDENTFSPVEEVTILYK